MSKALDEKSEKAFKIISQIKFFLKELKIPLQNFHPKAYGAKNIRPKNLQSKFSKTKLSQKFSNI